ncbi:unnamed protein product [Linum trigynum]|uniref:Uncharacterized protein n=1 Tax=Linum trigynum TaxID=586398 RepID=A0AAV2EFW0_9ROSI
MGQPVSRAIIFPCRKRPPDRNSRESLVPRSSLPNLIAPESQRPSSVKSFSLFFSMSMRTLQSDSTIRILSK